MKKGKKKKHSSIQWVIDSLGNPLLEKNFRDNHRTDDLRADEVLSWCPKCEKKWNIFEGELWKSSDIKLWKEKICPDCDSLVQ